MSKSLETIRAETWDYYFRRFMDRKLNNYDRDNNPGPVGFFADLRVMVHIAAETTDEAMRCYGGFSHLEQETNRRIERKKLKEQTDE
jgi:hypothetical protein